MTISLMLHASGNTMAFFIVLFGIFAGCPQRASGHHGLAQPRDERYSDPAGVALLLAIFACRTVSARPAT
ncbi:MAG: hypothetical protein ACLR0N_10220 [Bilophila wadsworthia]